MCQQAQIVYRFVYPPASATPPAYVYIHNLCNRLGVIIGNHILDVINEGGEYINIYYSLSLKQREISVWQMWQK